VQTIGVIRLLEKRLAWYPPGASEEPLWLDDDTARENLRAALVQRRLNLCFAAPAAEVPGAAGGSSASGRTSGLWAMEGEATAAEPPAEHDRDARAELLKQVDSAWERALEAPEGGERRVAEKAKRKVGGDRTVRARGKRQLTTSLMRN